MRAVRAVPCVRAGHTRFFFVWLSLLLSQFISLYLCVLLLRPFADPKTITMQHTRLLLHFALHRASHCAGFFLLACLCVALRMRMRMCGVRACVWAWRDVACRGDVMRCDAGGREREAVQELQETHAEHEEFVATLDAEHKQLMEER